MRNSWNVNLLWILNENMTVYPPFIRFFASFSGAIPLRPVNVRELLRRSDFYQKSVTTCEESLSNKFSQPVSSGQERPQRRRFA